MLSTAQAREFNVAVHDVAKRHGGKQMIHASNRIIPLRFENALLYTPVREPTEWELENLPRVVLTSDEPWNPAVLDDPIPDETDCTNTSLSPVKEIGCSRNLTNGLTD